MKRILAFCAIPLVGAALFASPASAQRPAHAPTVTATCNGLAVALVDYEGPGTPNTITTTIDGTPVTAHFGHSYSHTFSWTPTAAHTWKAVIDAVGTQFDRTFEGVQKQCQTPSTTIATTVPSTTLPATTTSTSEPATTEPATTVAAGCVDSCAPVDESTTSIPFCVDNVITPCIINREPRPDPAPGFGQPSVAVRVAQDVGPPPAVTDAPPTRAPSAPANRTLPATGVGTGILIFLASLLVIGGIGGALIARRRQ